MSDHLVILLTAQAIRCVYIAAGVGTIYMGFRLVQGSRGAGARAGAGDSEVSLQAGHFAASMKKVGFPAFFVLFGSATLLSSMMNNTVAIRVETEVVRHDPLPEAPTGSPAAVPPSGAAPKGPAQPTTEVEFINGLSINPIRTPSGASSGAQAPGWTGGAPGKTTVRRKFNGASMDPEPGTDGVIVVGTLDDPEWERYVSWKRSQFAQAAEIQPLGSRRLWPAGPTHTPKDWYTDPGHVRYQPGMFADWVEELIGVNEGEPKPTELNPAMRLRLKLYGEAGPVPAGGRIKAIDGGRIE
jgi:hypothetical protein